MYVVTNREVEASAGGLDQFGKKANHNGPNELRLAEVTAQGKGWRVEFLDDRLSTTEARALIKEFRLPLEPDAPHYASLKAACDITRRARKDNRHVLFFVHGFNNDMHDVISRAQYFEKRYDTEVLVFSWPADGGGLSGTLSYRSDKRDARASAGALERALTKLHDYLALITEARRRELYQQAAKKHPDAAEARDALYAKLLEKDCPFTVNALYHSMGNYLLKQLLKSTLSEGNGLTFDNVVLCQADTNNLDHGLWVDQIKFRNRLYITINENDYALRASRAKAGSEQLARLGHYLRNLGSHSAYYVNLTDAPWVKNSHSPFAEPAEKNDRLFTFFKEAFSGVAAEKDLRYFPEGNWFAPR